MSNTDRSIIMKEKISKATIGITGMHCKSCAALIENSLKEAEGVRCASVDFAASKASVEYDPAKTSPEKLAKIVRGMNYGASII